MSETYISFSEIESFLRCRTKWDISSANRRSIRHKTTPKLYLTLGSAVHKGLEAGVRRQQDPVEAVREYIKTEREAKVEEYKQLTETVPWPAELREFDEAADLAAGLVQQYFWKYGTNNPLADQGLTYLGIEVPFKIDITANLDPNWDGRSIFFCGTLDGIAVDEFGQIWIVENKTFTRKPSPEDIQWHFQAQGYAVALEWLTGMPVAGVLYNGIAKKLIQEPKVLQSGLLSMDKRQATTLQRYIDTLTRNGEMVDNPRYGDILSHLRGIDEQGDTRFFYREKAFFTTEQLDAWRKDFFSVVNEMLDNPRIYRTIPYDGCGDCWYRDLCHTTHSGGDVDYLMESRYTTGSYGTVNEVKGKTPVQISSVEELKEYLSD
ncbi:MAG: PD-(D/E)XK nuclease family protein [Gemmatimonadaceae bacterium]